MIIIKANDYFSINFMKQAIHIAHNLIFLFFAICNLYGQEIPPIEKFSPEDYGGENQNWRISQTQNKFIYVGNNKGLLEFNGAKWKTYQSPNNTIIRSVTAVGDRIYTGCNMEFGYWQKDKFGELFYTSLIPKLNKKMIEDEDIWNIISYNEWILFQSYNSIYFYNTKSDNFNVINSTNFITRTFNINNTIYYSVIGEGIYKIEEGKPKKVIHDPVLDEGIIVNLFPFEDGLLIQTRKNGFYVFKNNVLSIWDIPAANILKKINVYQSIQLNDSSFVIGTISDGLIYLSSNGTLIYQINQKNGLSNNTVLSLFEDVDENIWIGLDNGINCMNLKSPIRIFTDNEGSLGTVYAISIFANNLYLGTNQGLFFKEMGSDKPFHFIDGTAGQVWSLFIYNNELFCGHHYGTFIINKDKATLVADKLGTWNFRQIPNKENELLQGNYGGLYILSKNNGTWGIKNRINGFDNSVRHFEILNKNEIWISHGYKGVFRLKINDNFDSVTDIFREPTLPIEKYSSLIKFKNHLLYAFEKGVFNYDYQENEFKKDTILSPIVTDATYMSGKLVVDETQKLWAFSKENISYVTVDNLTNQFKINKISIPDKLRKAMIGYENITHLKNNTFLLGTANGYITLDLSSINQNKGYNIFLNTIELKNPEKANISVDFHKSGEFKGEFKYINNSVVFNYSVPDYNKYQTIKYQYKLLGRYNQWSEWTPKPELVFDNLPFGDYTFKIRAKIGNKLSNNVISYDFEILKPWYLSYSAIILYLFILLGITLFTHKTYKKYYKKQLEHKQLESEQLIISIKNEKLNQAIENKNRELAISTMSIIKKNELLASIKKELKNNPQKQDNASVIKLVDDNLNTLKDWSFFEEAFNNVDKDFLNKVKKMYPDLTPNDLRFCAYLRLNLSSKEIASLLNISVRSVETKRYRMRKRMNLEHKESLVNHILDI